MYGVFSLDMYVIIMYNYIYLFCDVIFTEHKKEKYESIKKAGK